MTDRLCIDLCSGLGGFSAAFRDSPDWEVITVDLDPRFKPSICADITKLSSQDIENASKLRDFESYEAVVVLAGPPCERFSLAATGAGNTFWPSAGIQDALLVVGACLRLIHEIQPDAWMLENPKERLRWILGKPHTTISYQDFGSSKLKPTDIWGSIALPLIKESRAKKVDWSTVPGYLELSERDRRIFRHKHWSISTEGGAKRALAPYGLSQAILEAVSQP